MKTTFTLIASALAATSVRANLFVLGDFEILDPFSSGLDTQPEVWYSEGTSVNPSIGPTAIGSATSNGGNGQLCAGQSCPMSFSVGQCSGTVNGPSGSGYAINIQGPGFNTPNLFCGPNTGYTSGSIGDIGRIQSWFSCDLGDGTC
ncbi:hypothetical protein BBK36DRAFT_1159799 [Trichoderma citrinoviride]|uniref:Uncharacterized protein n=1 Tax=Trichoderma citrinoviride TaxID=58853 RepID=A0A2T4B8P0_9HYPO|nr:hypothetical protein BBK36DRAFT_1159799 [Trichoderma citrinoviride]PTB65658.1 hypothetical protein BBK36DRAFT_1159799 [Trichoderma citrinoviride]